MRLIYRDNFPVWSCVSLWCITRREEIEFGGEGVELNAMTWLYLQCAAISREGHFLISLSYLYCQIKCWMQTPRSLTGHLSHSIWCRIMIIAGWPPQSKRFLCAPSRSTQKTHLSAGLQIWEICDWEMLASANSYPWTRKTIEAWDKIWWRLSFQTDFLEIYDLHQS